MTQQTDNEVDDRFIFIYSRYIAMLLRLGQR